MFEIQLTETQQRLTDGNSTDASLNATLALGEHRKDFSFPPDNVVHFGTGNRVVVRPEEALIVIFVLILWMGAIGLFVHRWGKIRNCEPYAPKFEAELHRGSCHDQANLINKRMSMSSKLVTQGTTLSMTANQQSFSQGFVSPSDHSLQFKPKMLCNFQLIPFTRAPDRIRCSFRLSTSRLRSRPGRVDRPWISTRCWTSETAKLFSRSTGNSKFN